MPSETDVWKVTGHLGPLMQIKEEKWRTTEMNKPLKWLQGWTAQRETLISITQVCMWWWAVWLHKKTGCGTKNHSACICDYIYNTGPKYGFQLRYLQYWLLSTFTEDCSTLNVDVFRGVLLVSSLCSLCSSGTRSAQTCFSLPPLNSLLSERGQRPGTVTYPGGGWRTPPTHLPPWEMGCSSPSLYFVYTWVPYSLLDHLTECRKSRCIRFPALFWIVRTDQ